MKLVWPEIAVTADVIAFRKRPGCESQSPAVGTSSGESPESASGLLDYFEVLLVKRRYPPFEGSWALPGGGVELDEDLEDAARRELLEETGIIAKDLRQFKTYGAPGRDPRCRVVSVVFWTILGDTEADSTSAGSDAAETGWFPITGFPPLAFDHAKIIADLKSTAFRQ